MTDVPEFRWSRSFTRGSTPIKKKRNPVRWWIESKSSIEEIQVLRPPDNCKDNNVLNKMDKAISSRWFSCLDFWTQFSFRVKMGCSRFMVRPLPCRTGTVNRKKTGTAVNSVEEWDAKKKKKYFLSRQGSEKKMNSRPSASGLAGHRQPRAASRRFCCSGCCRRCCCCSNTGRRWGWGLTLTRCDD